MPETIPRPANPSHGPKSGDRQRHDHAGDREAHADSPRDHACRRAPQPSACPEQHGGDQWTGEPHLCTTASPQSTGASICGGSTGGVGSGGPIGSAGTSIGGTGSGVGCGITGGAAGGLGRGTGSGTTIGPGIDGWERRASASRPPRLSIVIVIGPPGSTCVLVQNGPASVRNSNAYCNRRAVPTRHSRVCVAHPDGPRGCPHPSSRVGSPRPPVTRRRRPRRVLPRRR